MKLLIYSDLHLEFNNPIQAPADFEADILILAGDIITFKPRGFERLKEFLKDWKKPALFVAGNHEHYTSSPMNHGWLLLSRFLTDTEELKNLKFLSDSNFSYQDVEFFGGTMWTDFNKSNPNEMLWAHKSMNDYRMIYRTANQTLSPSDTITLHENYKKELIKWLEANQNKKRVVISHHAPCINPNSNYKQSKLQAAYNSLDMIEIIEKYQPELWIYGHTHESDDQFIGRTRIISNPFGYYDNGENSNFDLQLLIEV